MEDGGMTKRKDGPKLLTISEAAGRLGVSSGTLRSWADKGIVKAIKLPSGYRRFTEAEIERQRREMGFADEPTIAHEG
jgi:excisionase family DNA binding protein